MHDEKPSAKLERALVGARASCLQVDSPEGRMLAIQKDRASFKRKTAYTFAHDALEEAVFRPRQAEILAQCRAFVFFAENAATLKFRHDFVDEIVQAGR
jgi:hypothetical protein